MHVNMSMPRPCPLPPTPPPPPPTPPPLRPPPPAKQAAAAAQEEVDTLKKSAVTTAAATKEAVTAAEKEAQTLKPPPPSRLKKVLFVVGCFLHSYSTAVPPPPPPPPLPSSASWASLQPCSIRRGAHRSSLPHPPSPHPPSPPPLPSSRSWTLPPLSYRLMLGLLFALVSPGAAAARGFISNSANGFGYLVESPAGGLGCGYLNYINCFPSVTGTLRRWSGTLQAVYAAPATYEPLTGITLQTTDKAAKSATQVGTD